jgi:hypothetical protein
MFELDIYWTHAINARAGHAGLFDWAMINVSRLAVPLLVFAVALQWWRSAPFRQIDRHTISEELVFRRYLMYTFVAQKHRKSNILRPQLHLIG